MQPFYIFEHCVRYYARVVHRVLGVSCVVAMQRRIYAHRLACRVQQIIRSGFLNYVIVNVTFRRPRMLRSRSPIVVVQLQTVGNMWNWRKRAWTKFRCQGPDKRVSFFSRTRKTHSGIFIWCLWVWKCFFFFSIKKREKGLFLNLGDLKMSIFKKEGYFC